MRICQSLILSLSVLAASAQSEMSPELSRALNESLDLSGYELALVYSNDFDRPQSISREEDFIAQHTDGTWHRTGRPSPDADWIVEGSGGVILREGQLVVAPIPLIDTGQTSKEERGTRSHMVVWAQPVFPRDFLLEFEMNPSGSTNGLTIVFFCAAGRNGQDLFDVSLPPRQAIYTNYHSGAIANYSDAYWSLNTQAEAASNRLRKNPGFQLAARSESLTLGSTGTSHRVRVLKNKGHIEVEINGRVVTRWEDRGQPHGAGRIGFRCMAGVTYVAYDNIRVWQITQTSPGR